MSEGHDQELTAQTASARTRIPWFNMILVAVCFYLLEHNLDASLRFQEVMSAQSLSDIENLESLFEQQSLRQFAGLVLGLYGALCILQRGQVASRRFGFLAGLIFFYTAWTCLSLAWSDDVNMSFRRLLLFLFMGVAAVALSGRFTPRDLARICVFAPGVYVLIGLWAEHRNGTFDPGLDGYRFGGTLHPNLQAIHCALLCMGCVALYMDTEQHKRRYVILGLLAFLFLYLTKSRTALASMVFAFLTFWLFAMPMSKKLMAVFSVAALLSLGFLMANTLMPALEDTARMGRTDVPEEFGNFTGRTALWEQCIEFVRERPLLGYGYASFWNQRNSWLIMERQGWPISHAHNAYLDAMLEGGPPSLFMIGLIMIMAIVNSFRSFARTRDWGYGFCCFLFLFCAANSFLESAAKQRTFLAFIGMLALSMLAFHYPAPASQPPEEAPATEPQAQEQAA